MAALHEILIVVGLVSTNGHLANPIRKDVLSGRVAADGTIDISNGLLDSPQKLSLSMVRKSTEGQAVADGSIEILDGLLESAPKVSASSASLVRKATEGQVTADGSIEISNGRVVSKANGVVASMATITRRAASSAQEVQRMEGKEARHQLDTATDREHTAIDSDSKHGPEEDHPALKAGPKLEGAKEYPQGQVREQGDSRTPQETREVRRDRMPPLEGGDHVHPLRPIVPSRTAMGIQETLGATFNDVTMSSEKSSHIETPGHSERATCIFCHVQTEKPEGIREVEANLRHTKIGFNTASSANMLAHILATANGAVISVLSAISPAFATRSAGTTDAIPQQVSKVASAVQMNNKAKLKPVMGPALVEADALAVQQPVTTAAPVITTTSLVTQTAVGPLPAESATEEEGVFTLVNTLLFLALCAMCLVCLTGPQHLRNPVMSSADSGPRGQNDRFARSSRSMRRTKSSMTGTKSMTRTKSMSSVTRTKSMPSRFNAFDDKNEIDDVPSATECTFSGEKF